MSEENFVVYDGVKYELGTLEDFSDEGLANPDEIERQAIKAELEPILALPAKNKKRGYFQAWDCSEEIGFDAFGTVDFDKYRGGFDKARYKADKLKEQLKDLVIRIRILNERIPGEAKHELLRQVKIGVVDTDDIPNWDMWLLAKMYVRALKLRKQILQLHEASKRRKEQQLQKWLDSLD